MSKSYKGVIIAIDFDGTCITHEYPYMGRDIGAWPVLVKLVDLGARLILNTMRSGDKLDEAVRWFAERGIPLFGVNNNPDQRAWTESPKVYANIYIDDAALGAPLISDPTGGRPYIDWKKVDEMLFPVN